MSLATPNHRATFAAALSHATRWASAAAALTVAALGVLLVAGPAHAQDYGLAVQQGMARMNEIVNQAQQRGHAAIQQRMQDPVVQAAWQRHLQQTGGRPQVTYYQFTYWYVYTNGFSAQGMAHARANEAGMQAREQAAWQGVRQAEAQRGQAQQAQRDGYFRNQQEAGRHLQGQSTYVAPNGAGVVLPHTWQPGATYAWQGQTYRVDAGGQYHVLAPNGGWVPLQR